MTRPSKPGVNPLNEGQSGRALLVMSGRMSAAHFKRLSVLLIAGLSLLAGVAQAQSTFLGSANGLKVGEGRLHPFIDLELHFDSAAGLFPRNGAITGLQPELLAHLRPGLKLELPSDTVQLDVYGNLDYIYFTGLLTPFDQPASRLEAEASVAATINPKGTVGLLLQDDLRRGDRTHNPLLGVGVLSLYNEARALVPIRPGGGALEISPKVAFTVEFFQPAATTTPIPGCTGDPVCDPNVLHGMDYLNVQPGLEARWKFLPKTAVVLDATFDLRSYVTATAGNPPADLLKASVGLAGLLTPKISVQAKLGWGYDFAGSGASTLLAHLEGTYLLSQTMAFKAGYLRTLQPVPVYGVYGDDRVYGDAKVQLDARLNLHGTLAFDYVSYYRNANRNDTFVTLDVGPEYQILQWLAVSGSYLFSAHAAPSSTALGLNYARHQVFIRVSFQY